MTATLMKAGPISERFVAALTRTAALATAFASVERSGAAIDMAAEAFAAS